MESATQVDSSLKRFRASRLQARAVTPEDEPNPVTASGPRTMPEFSRPSHCTPGLTMEAELSVVKRAVLLVSGVIHGVQSGIRPRVR